MPSRRAKRLLHALCLGDIPTQTGGSADGDVGRRFAEAEGMEQGMDSAKKVLKEVSELDEGSKLAAMILEMYALILEGKTIRELLKAADEVKAAAACRVI